MTSWSRRLNGVEIATERCPVCSKQPCGDREWMYIMIADERFEWNHTASALQVHCRRGENDCWSEKKRSVSMTMAVKKECGMNGE